MASNVRRPTSVWVAQILLFFFALTFGALLVVTAPAIVNRGPDASLVVLVFALALNLVLLALFVIAFWGMFRRRSYGRWLGFGMLLLTFIFSVVGQIIRPDGPTEYAQFDSSKQAAAAYVGPALVALLFLVLLYQLALGKRVVAFFAPDE